MKKAFTIIELMVVLGLFAVIAALGLVGLNVLQKSSRDYERKSILGEIAGKIEDIRKINKSYPTTVVFNQTSVTINSQPILTLSGSNQSDVVTNASRTKYFYQKTTAGFILCAKLEGGNIQSAGSVKDGCVGKL